MIQISLHGATYQQEELHSIVEVVSKINANFGSLAYQPIVYLHKDIHFEQYIALLCAADLLLVTSLRDGMNLTTHEYICCQKDKYGPLIISEVF